MLGNVDKLDVDGSRRPVARPAGQPEPRTLRATEILGGQRL